MKPRRIAVLGGGIAALSAAYQLTRTDALRARHEVTVYQIGWRLGGKGATGRSGGRIEEHGLHVWFGYYDNAFRMLRDVYRDWERQPDNPLRHWRDAFKPQSFTPIGPDCFPFHWPENAGVPGDGHLSWTPWQAFTEVIGLLAAVLETWIDDRERRALPAPAPVTVPVPLMARMGALGAGPALRATDGVHSFAGVHDAVRHAHRWAQAVGSSHHGQHDHVAGIAELIGHSHRSFAKVTPLTADREHGLVTELLDLFQAFARGFVADLLIAGRTARQLDAEEFRDWLIRHGATPAVVRESFIVRALYDTMFQYREGDLARPDYAAGTALQVILRLFGGYKGAALYMMQAGMGEVVIAPLYELLKARGVRFEFFREVTRLELDDARRRVRRVHLKRQAETRDGTAYRPTFTLNGLICWPSQPFWEQLEDGERLRDAGVDFESPWSDHGPGRTETLEQGRQFDDVVLGISLGAFQKLNDDPGLADELIAASPAFRRMTEGIGLVPSMALQVWSPRTLTGLGWGTERPAAVAGVEPLDIWADMTPTLKYEDWAGPERPQSVHYFTGVMDTTAYRRPRRDRDTQAEGQRALGEICVRWLGDQGPRLWPGAVTPTGQFDWNVLWTPGAQIGPQRLRAQYVRANLSPTECCVGSAAGTTRHRLAAGGSGFDNLTLAGCWIDSGFNTTCIEAAVMSGMQAARAICGEPVHVLGEDFLQRPGHAFGDLPGPLQVLGETVEFVGTELTILARYALTALGLSDGRGAGDGHRTGDEEQEETRP